MDPGASRDGRWGNGLSDRRPYAHRKPRVIMSRYLIAIVAAVLLAACGEEDVTIPGMEGREAVGLEAITIPASSDMAMEMTPAPTFQQPDSFARDMVIRTGRARVEVDSLEAAVEALQTLAERVDGYTTDVTIRTGRRQRREAMVTLRIPAERFDSVVSGLEPLGKVEMVTVSSQDVGEEYVDVRARVANDRRLEERLIELLAQRTGDLEEVLAVERELARVRSSIDRQEGRLRYLRSQVATSTLAVDLHEPASVIGSYRGESVIGRAFRAAWRNFVRVITGIIASLGYVVPLGAIAALVWWGVRVARSRT